MSSKPGALHDALATKLGDRKHIGYGKATARGLLEAARIEAGIEAGRCPVSRLVSSHHRKGGVTRRRSASARSKGGWRQVLLGLLDLVAHVAHLLREVYPDPLAYTLDIGHPLRERQGLEVLKTIDPLLLGTLAPRALPQLTDLIGISIRLLLVR